MLTTFIQNFIHHLFVKVDIVHRQDY